MIDETRDLRDFLGDRIKKTKLFTIFDLNHNKSKFDKETIGYTKARKQVRERIEQDKKAFEKQQEKNKAPELLDASDKS